MDELFNFDEIGLIGVSAKPSLAAYVVEITAAKRRGENVVFLVGDMVLHGEAIHGEEFGAIVDSLGYELATINNYASLCRRFPRNLRTVPGVTARHYDAVRRLPNEVALSLLERAGRGEIKTSGALRQLVREISRKCPECKETMLKRDDLWVCLNCEHEIDASEETPKPARVTLEISASVNGQLVVMDEALKVGKIYRVTITEMAA